MLLKCSSIQIDRGKDYKAFYKKDVKEVTKKLLKKLKILEITKI